MTSTFGIGCRAKAIERVSTSELALAWRRRARESCWRDIRKGHSCRVPCLGLSCGVAARVSVSAVEDSGAKEEKNKKQKE